MRGEIRIRSGRPGDLPDLTEIYNHYVCHTPATFDTEPLTVEQRRGWLEHYGEEGPYRLLVAAQRERVLGYATSSPLRPKPGYRTSVETSVYLAPRAVGQSIGSRLYGALFEILDAQALHRAYAAVALPNPASLALHRNFGFRSLGVFHEVGFKHGRYWSVEWMEKRLDDLSGNSSLPGDASQPEE